MCHDFLIKRERDIVSDPVHPKPKTNENATLFLRLGLPSTLIRHENKAFKNPFQTRNFQNHAPCWRFSLDKKHFENVGFQKKRRRLSIHVTNRNTQGCTQAFLPTA